MTNALLLRSKHWSKKLRNKVGKRLKIMG